jgi:hypothetical protein
MRFNSCFTKAVFQSPAAQDFGRQAVAGTVAAYVTGRIARRAAFFQRTTVSRH